MNTYLEYECFRLKYIALQQRYDEIVAEKERLFELTLPTPINYEKEKIDGGEAQNKFDKYLISKEEKHIEQRLQECLSLLRDRKVLLDIKEAELRKSKNLYDKIYRLYYLDKMRVERIANYLHYSARQTYRILRIITENVQNMAENVSK